MSPPRIFMMSYRNYPNLFPVQQPLRRRLRQVGHQYGSGEEDVCQTRVIAENTSYSPLSPSCSMHSTLQQPFTIANAPLCGHRTCAPLNRLLQNASGSCHISSTTMPPAKSSRETGVGKPAQHRSLGSGENSGWHPDLEHTRVAALSSFSFFASHPTRCPILLLPCPAPRHPFRASSSGQHRL